VVPENGFFIDNTREFIEILSHKDASLPSYRSAPTAGPRIIIMSLEDRSPSFPVASGYFHPIFIGRSGRGALASQIGIHRNVAGFWAIISPCSRHNGY
jgi:hypothetical protein